jgi:translation initiation factor 2 subunit 1
VTMEIKDLGAYVRLIEYDNIEGFIMLSQVTAKRVKTVQKFLKIGKQEMMEVLRVDEDRMCIDLSKKSLKADAIAIA